MRAKNYQLVESVKPADMTSQGDRLYFVDQPQLRTLNNRAIQVTSISAFTADSIPNAPSGNPVCPLAEFVKAFLVINVDSQDKFLYIPLVELNPVVPDQDNYSPAVREFFQLVTTTLIDWTKSYIQFGAAPAAGVYSFIFGVRYYDLNKDLAGAKNPGIL